MTDAQKLGEIMDKIDALEDAKPKVNVDNIRPHLIEYGEAKAEVDRLNAVMKQLGEVIRPALVDKGVITIAPYTFEVNMMKGRKTLDKKAMVEAGIDLEPFEKVGAPFTKLVVKDIK